MPFNYSAFRELRKLVGSQERLAEKLGEYAKALGYSNTDYSQPTISRLEGEHIKPSLNTLDLVHLVAEEFGCPLEFYKKPERLD